MQRGLAASTVGNNDSLRFKFTEYPFSDPLSDEASHFYKSGRPFLQRSLPFWLAVLADRLLILLIPVAGVIYPLVQFLPVLYGWEMERRIFKLYAELRSIEQKVEARDAGQGMAELALKLERLEDRANRLKVALSYAHMLYTLREHIALVHERLQKRQERPKEA